MPALCHGPLCDAAAAQGRDRARGRSGYNKMCPDCFHHENGTMKLPRRQGGADQYCKNWPTCEKWKQSNRNGHCATCYKQQGGQVPVRRRPAGAITRRRPAPEELLLPAAKRQKERELQADTIVSNGDHGRRRCDSCEGLRARVWTDSGQALCHQCAQPRCQRCQNPCPHVVPMASMSVCRSCATEAGLKLPRLNTKTTAHTHASSSNAPGPKIPTVSSKTAPRKKSSIVTCSDPDCLKRARCFLTQWSPQWSDSSPACESRSVGFDFSRESHDLLSAPEPHVQARASERLPEFLKTAWNHYLGGFRQLVKSPFAPFRHRAWVVS